MKKLMNFTGWLVMAATFFAGVIACNKVDNAIDEPTTPDAPETYTMTITASKSTDDDPSTRALSLDGKTLDATWTAGDAIRVLKRREMMGSVDFAELGTLTASTVSADWLTATFTGSLDADKVTTAGGLAEGDKLLLGYPGTNLGPSTSSFVFNYTGQDGTLDKIATNYDYCMTTTSKSKMVTVSAVNGSEVTASGTATFENQQAIVRFNLYESDGTTPVTPTRLDITAVGLVPSVALPESGDIAATPTEQTLTLTPDGSTNIIYAALRGISGQTVKLRATNGDKYFTYTTKSAVTFTQGKFYDVKVKMADGYKTTDLASLGDDYTTSLYEVLTGTLPSGKHVTISAGAHVKLNGVTISETDYAGIECLGDASIILVGENSVSTTSNIESAAIQAGGSGTTLTISGSGRLTATASQGAGIGSGDSEICGNIIITGGTITATGGTGSAGIGSGSFLGNPSRCGDITITGGTITATGGNLTYDRGGAGIGSGYASICGNITISGGSITATKGTGAYSIGKGGEYYSYTSSCGKVTIGGMVYYDGTAFQNGGDTYLATSPLVYPAP